MTVVKCVYPQGDTGESCMLERSVEPVTEMKRKPEKKKRPFGREAHDVTSSTSSVQTEFKAGQIVPRRCPEFVLLGSGTRGVK